MLGNTRGETEMVPPPNVITGTCGIPLQLTVQLLLIWLSLSDLLVTVLYAYTYGNYLVDCW